MNEVIPWQQINIGNQSKLYSVWFIDSVTGYVVGDSGKIYKTIDGGNNWISNYFDSTNVYFGSYSGDFAILQFINNKIGYLLTGMEDQIYKTTDSGNNWVKLISPYSEAASSFAFINPDTGYIVGDSSVYFKTVNGGLSWETVSNVVDNPFFSIYFLSDSIGFALGENFYATRNGGQSWIKKSSISSFNFGACIFFTDSLNGYLFPGNNLESTTVIMKTIDGGSSWSNIILDSTGTHHVNSIFFINKNIGFIGTSDHNTGGFYYTNNGGLNWSFDSTNYAITVINFPNSNIGYAIGYSANGIIYKYNTNVNYHWSPAYGLSDTIIPDPVAKPLSTQTYRVKIRVENGCTATDSVTVYFAAQPAPSICLVDVDPVTDKNMIVWNKPVSSVIDSFIIYTEDFYQSGVYDKIGAVPYDSLNEYIDINSKPSVQSNSYKVSVMDKCGMESALSGLHKTIHLNINQGTGNVWNLIWNDYDGFIPTAYYIYRGATTSNLELIGSTTYGNTSYSDLQAPKGSLYYQIQVNAPSPCSLLKSTSLNSSKSNVVFNGVMGLDESVIGEITIYPNPAKDKITIENIDVSSLYTIEILNISGQVVINQTIQNNKSIDVSNLTSGVYVVKISNDSGVFVSKLIKE